MAHGILDGEDHVQRRAFGQHVEGLAHEGAREVVQLWRDSLPIPLSTHETSL